MSTAPEKRSMWGACFGLSRNPWLGEKRKAADDPSFGFRCRDCAEYFPHDQASQRDRELCSACGQVTCPECSKRVDRLDPGRRIRLGTLA